VLPASCRQKHCQRDVGSTLLMALAGSFFDFSVRKDSFYYCPATAVSFRGV
jgi:hypothetical protein